MQKNSSIDDGEPRNAPSQVLDETFKVLTNLQHVRSQSEHCDNVLKEHEDLKKSLKEKLLRNQSANACRQEILNLSEHEQKSSLENYSTIKENIKGMYYSNQRLDKILAKFTIERNLRELTLEANDAFFKKLESKYDGKHKDLRCRLEKDVEDLCKQNRTIEREISEVASKCKENRSATADGIMQEHAELQKVSDGLKEKLKNQTAQLQVKLPEEQEAAPLENQDLAQIVESEKEIDAKISVIENEIICATSAAEDLAIAECRTRIQDLEKYIAHIKEPCDGVEDPLHEELLKDIDCLKSQIEHNTCALNQALDLCAIRTNRLAEISEDEKQDAETVDMLSAELISLEQACAETASDLNPDDLALEDQLCTVKITSLLQSVASYETTITEIKMKSNMLKTSAEAKLQTITEKILTRDMTHEKTCDNQIKELQEIDSANRQLQETLEQLAAELEQKKTDASAKLIEIDEATDAVKSLDLQADGIRIEMKRLAASNERQKELMPEPPLRRAFKPAPANVDSDSSIDGEKLTYSQFMKRRRLNSKNRM